MTSLASETLVSANPDCEVEVTLTYSTSGKLLIHYRVRNRSIAPLYLFNKLYKVPRRHPITNKLIYEVESNLANIQLDNQKIKISKAVASVPDWVFVEALHTPCLSRVLPGEQFAENFEILIPLVPYSIYDPTPTNGVISTHPVFIELGYFTASAYTESFIMTVESSSGQAYYIDAFPADEQSLIGVGPFQKLVPVIEERQS